MSLTPIAESDRPRFLADENFNGHIVAGLRRVYPELDLLTFAEANIVKGLSDPELIEETAELGRILLTHDKRTMPDHFADTLARTLPLGLHLPGVLLLSRTMAIGAAINEIALIWGASRHDEYRDRIVFLPM
ncbi:MAG TPA: hypothetical protein VH591_08215 [Ktedonobacterales bacterium]